MRKLLSRYRLGDKLLKIYEVKGNGSPRQRIKSPHLRGFLYEYKWDTSVSPNKVSLVEVNSVNCLVPSGDAQAVIKVHFGMGAARLVTSDNYIDINHRVIWTNNDYDEWERCMKIDYPDGVDEDGNEVINYETYCEDCETNLYDERANLNVPVDGVIVAFADLGLWDGHHNGAKTFGSNVKNILYSSNDYQDWYCDRYNVRCTDIHHDGTNTYLYRVARDKRQAQELVNRIAYEGMTEQEFMNATKSLRPYVAKVYGW
jgi:hypothetical protein